MAAPNIVEYEAAKFLQKLIQESTDEPSKLATKLYVILQHMKASGKENSMPYQVISKAMETVVNQHGLDIDALMSSRVPSSAGSHSGEGARAQAAGCSQPVGAFTDSKSGMTENNTSRTDGLASGRPPAGPSSTGHDPFQGCNSQRSTRSFDQESPSSLDTRSTNSHSQDRRENAAWEQQGRERDSKRASIKRKRPETSAVEPQIDGNQLPDAHTAVPDMRKERLIDKGEMSGTFPGPPIDLKDGEGPVDSEYWRHGFIKGTTPNFRERVVPGHMMPPNQGDVSVTDTNSTSCSDAAGVSHVPMNVDGLLQGGNPSNVGEMGMLRSVASRDTEKSPVIQASGTSMPFKEHHLKQLRAQCLVFLAFRNGLPPKRLHLEIALGNILPKEGSSGYVDGAQSELLLDKGKQRSQQTTPEASSATELTSLQGNLATITKNDRGYGSSVPSRSVTYADASLKETENSKVVDMESGPTSTAALLGEEKKHLNERGFLEAELQSQAGAASHVACAASGNLQLKPEMLRWTGMAHDDPHGSVLPVSMQRDIGNRKESSLPPQHDSSTRIQERADNRLSASWKAVSGMNSEYHRQVAANDANLVLRTASHDSSLDTRRRSISDVSNVIPASVDKSSEVEDTGFAPSPKYTLSERCIMAHQKIKLVTEQKWMQKVQKADERIVSRFNELKETVSSSEDISAKTRSVIELKKLQLLELQRRLRSNILNDFFKPVQKEMDQLKAIKKHRIGRRLKHVEKYEQKMKEERQKRIRERQKEFFSEVEVHRERLEDMFKFKRERCKGFNRHVKEFHKKKERIHKEKFDRIQREKINLLKINDVEGYLRMVKDAKSDRVNQLLKETEKYLLKLGSKLKEAKSVARQVDMDESGIAFVDDSTEVAVETGDGSDQAKHYLESNEKYYLIAHSIKENVAEQPSGLVGGKLREYQMNGLRWLLSLYNNNLNGILADEMGLGKTVQVISLLCYLMQAKNDRGPFLVVVPSSVLPGWEQELSFWAPSINKIVYAGPPEDRRRLFKEIIIHQKFNVLLTTYEYLMNKHDRPKLSKIHWHYVIIDEGHRIKNASCKLNADLKYYRSAHRLLLTGTPLQNNLEELWALLNFLLPNIFNSSEDFSQWFNKPFESSVDNPADEALLSEEENLLIINRLHQVLRPFVLRRLKHKVENELPEKIERLVRCEASAYQKLLMKRVEDNLGALGVHKSRSVHNSVMELRNICNHPYISQLHSEQVDKLIPKHYLPPVVRLCGKLEVLDRLLPKLKATNHRVLLFSTMTRLLDVMEEYLVWKQYRYLRLDGHTSGQDRGALIDAFNRPDSPFFIFLLSIRAGGVGVNLQAADTVIIFDTDWNPQVDLQAQARAHRIGQKKEVLVLRLETVHTVEEQVRAAAEHKLGVANQSITAGFFDNNTSAEDRKEYLESLLRESKKEEAAFVLDDDGLNDILARSEPEIDVFEAIDQQRREEEMAIWKRVVSEQGNGCSEDIPPLPPRLLTDDDLKAFCEAMKAFEVSGTGGSSAGMKRKGGYLGGLDTQVYGRGKRAREVRSYEEQWGEDEFEKMCKADSPETAGKAKVEQMDVLQPPSQTPTSQVLPSLASSPFVKKDITSPPPAKRGRGRPRRTPLVDASSSPGVHAPTIAVTKPTRPDSQGSPALPSDVSGVSHHADGVVTSARSQAVSPLPSSLDIAAQPTPTSASVTQPKRQGRKGKSIEKNKQEQSGSGTVRRRGRKPSRILSSIPSGTVYQDSEPKDQLPKQPSSETCALVATDPSTERNSSVGLVLEDSKSSELADSQAGTEPCKSNERFAPNVPAASQSNPMPSGSGTPDIPCEIAQIPVAPSQAQGRSQKVQVGEEMPRRRGRRKSTSSAAVPYNLGVQNATLKQSDGKGVEIVERKVIATRSRKMSKAQSKNAQEEAHKGNTSGALVSKDSVTAVPCNVSSTVRQSEDLHPVPSQSTFGSPTVSTNDLGKFPTPANLPPITSSGLTNVIVLALESTARALNPTGMSLSTPSVLASKPDSVMPEQSCAPSTAILEEEMSAPPGFDTPRPSSFGASVQKTLESVDTEISKAPEAKSDSVVLGLESMMENIEPSSVVSQNMTERDESRVLTSRNTVQETEHPSKPQGSQQEVESANGAAVVVQPEEEMVSPPGFDIPQQSLPETAVRISLQCDDSQEKRDILMSSKVTLCNMPGVDFEKSQEDVNKYSSGSSEPLRFSTLASQNEGTDSCNDHLSSVVASDSGEKIKGSSDHIEEDSVPPGFATSQTPLAQDKNDKPCEGRESHITAESAPSESSADIPVVESEEKDESCVGIGEAQECLGASVLKFDDEKGSINVSPVSENFAEPRQVEVTGIIDFGERDCISREVQLDDDNKNVSTSEMAEKPREGVINMTAPVESPISPVCLDDKTSKEVGSERPPAVVSTLDPMEDRKMKLTDVSGMSEKDLTRPEGSAKHGDAFLEDVGVGVGVGEKQADPLMEETDAAASIEETNVMPNSISNESIEKPQPEHPFTLVSVSEPLEGANTTLSDLTQADGTNEIQINPSKETDCAASIKESIMMPASIDDGTLEKTQCIKSSPLGCVSKPEDDINTELQDETEGDGADERKASSLSFVSHPINETDIAMSIEKSITVPTSANSDAAEETQPDVGSVSESGDIDNTNCVMRIECLKCPEENVEIGDAREKDGTACEMDTGPTISMDTDPKENVEAEDLCPKGDAVCEMDIDSDNVMAVVTAPTNGTTLSTPDASNDGNAPKLISAGKNETMIVVSMESHISFEEKEKDGPNQGEEDYSAGSASLIKVSDVQPVPLMNSKPEEKAKEVNADVVPLENMDESGKLVNESRKVAEIEEAKRAPDVDVEHDAIEAIVPAVGGEEAKRVPDVDVECEEAKTDPDVEQEDCNPCDVDQAVEGQEAEKVSDADVEYEEAQTAPDVDQEDCITCNVIQAVEGEEAKKVPDAGVEYEEAKTAPDVDSGDNTKKLNDLVKEDSVTPEFAKASLVQVEHDKPSDGRVNHILVESGPSEEPGEACDIPIAESGDKLAEEDNLVIKKDEPSVNVTGEGEICRGGFVSKGDDEKDSINVAAVSGDVPETTEANNETTDIIDCGQEKCTPMEVQLIGDNTNVNTLQLTEKPSEDVSSLMKPVIEGPICPTHVESKTLYEVEPEKVSAITYTLDPEDDEIKPSDVSDTSAKEIKCPEENAELKDACQTIEKSTDDADSTEKGITLPASTSKETVEGNQLETAVLGSVLESGDGVNTTLAAEGYTKTGDACRVDAAACEMDIDSHNLLDDPIKSVGNCPKEVVEVGNACQKNDVGCEMDIDSHNLMTDATETTSSTALSTPDASNDRSNQDALSAGDNESVKGSTESDMVLRDDGKDGASHVTQNDFSGIQRSSLVEASPVQAVSVVKYPLEEKDTDADMLETVHAGNSVPCVSKAETSNDDKTEDSGSNVAEATANNSSDVPDAVHAGDNLPSTSKLDNFDDDAGEKANSCSDIPKVVHAGDSAPCTLRVEISYDGNSRRDVAQAAEEETNVDDGSSDIADAVPGGSTVPFRSKTDARNDECGKDDNFSDMSVNVHAGDSVPSTSKLDSSNDVESRDASNNVAKKMESIEGNGYGGDVVPSTTEPVNSDDEADEKDDSHPDIPEAVPCISNPEKFDDAETRDSGINVNQPMEEVEANKDDGSSGIPDAAHATDSVPSAAKPDDDGTCEKDDKWSQMPDAVHDGEDVR